MGRAACRLKRTNIICIDIIDAYHRYGAKKESLWIGHSVNVAFENYLMVTDDDFAVAAGKKVVQSIDQTEPVSTQEVMSV